MMIAYLVTLVTLIIWYIDEPFTWFAFVISRRDHLTPLEYTFFITSASFEMLGQLLFIFLVVKVGVDEWRPDEWWNRPSTSIFQRLLEARLGFYFVSSLPAYIWATSWLARDLDGGSDADLQLRILSSWSFFFACVSCSCGFIGAAVVSPQYGLGLFYIVGGGSLYMVTTTTELDLFAGDDDRLGAQHSPYYLMFIYFRCLDVLVFAPNIAFYLAASLFDALPSS